MSYTFFGREVSEPFPYLLLSVSHNNIKYCGCYYKGDDGEYITSILTGEKFYSLSEFVLSIKGLEMVNEWKCCSYYDEPSDNWIPLIYI